MDKRKTLIISAEDIREIHGKLGNKDIVFILLTNPVKRFPEFVNPTGEFYINGKIHSLKTKYNNPESKSLK